MNFTILTSVFGWTIAIKISNPVNALGVIFARVIRTFVSCILLTMGTRCTRRANARISIKTTGIAEACTTMLAWASVTDLTKIFTIMSTVSLRALAEVGILVVSTHSTVLTWFATAKVNLGVTASSHPP